MLASSSNRAVTSTSTATCLPRSAARTSAATIGLSPEVRYRHCLMASTWGSSAASLSSSSTDAENES